jgi:ABC-2 type transport system permease protein
MVVHSKGITDRRPAGEEKGVQLLIHLVAAAVVVWLIVGIGAAAFGADLPANEPAYMAAVLLYCVAVFGIGLALSTRLPTAAKAVGVVGNIIFPSMFFAGVWTPGDRMPESIRFLRDITAMGVGMSAMQDAWAGSWPAAVHVISLLAFSALCLVVAARFCRWE